MPNGNHFDGYIVAINHLISGKIAIQAIEMYTREVCRFSVEDIPLHLVGILSGVHASLDDAKFDAVLTTLSETIAMFRRTMEAEKTELAAHEMRAELLALLSSDESVALLLDDKKTRRALSDAITAVNSARRIQRYSEEYARRLHRPPNDKNHSG